LASTVQTHTVISKTVALMPAKKFFIFIGDILQLN
jgi:hypothetical protein